MLDIICAPVEVVFASSRHDRSKVTVAVTLFNYGHTVLSTLESVGAQHLPDVDLIVVDDGSTDSGPSTVERWMNAHAERFGRCQLVRHLDNQGLAGARNQAFSLAATPLCLLSGCRHDNPHRRRPEPPAHLHPLRHRP